MAFSEMTSKERLMTVLRGGIPDRVPCMPDFSNMIPCRLTGKPFWEIYMKGNAALYKAYCKAVEYFGIDGWFQTSSAMTFQRENRADIRVTRTIDPVQNNRFTVHSRYDIDGDVLTQGKTMFIADSPVQTERLMKDIVRDFPIYKKMLGKIVSCETPLLEEQRAMCGDKGIFCLTVGYPGIQAFIGAIEGGVEAAVYACYDEPEIMEEWASLMDRDSVRMTEMMLDQKPDVILLGGSGTLTLATPALVRKYALPTIKTITRMCKQAGIPSMLHSCGRSMAFLEMLYNETDLDCINPLEAPPMGDVDLAEVKRRYGDKLTLMGNLNTTNVLIEPKERVIEACKSAIDAAARNGRFILSTGDQLGRDTPDENIFAMVETAKTYGKYN